MKESYTSASEPPVYRIGSADMIPAFIVWNYEDYDAFSLFNITWSRFDGKTYEQKPPINCQEYMVKYLTDKVDAVVLESFRAELFD